MCIRFLRPDPRTGEPVAQPASASPRREVARGKASGSFGGFRLDFDRQPNDADGTKHPDLLKGNVERIVAHREPRMGKTPGFYAETAKSQ